MKKIFGYFSCIVVAASAGLAGATLILQYTQLDRDLGSGRDAVHNYMREHSIDEREMITLLEENIYEHLSKLMENPNRMNAAGSSVGHMAMIGSSNALAHVMVYATDKSAVERLRIYALKSYFRVDPDGGLPLASNVMTQAWRSSSEFNRVRMEYYVHAKSEPQEAGKKYVDFMKWAVLNGRLGAYLRTWDRNVMDIDPAWRTNELRRISAEFQKQYLNTPTGTNNILEIIQDYEVAAGLRQPDSKAEQQTPSEPTDADIGNVLVLDAQSNTAQTPVPASRTSIILVLGVVIIASFIVYLIWKSQRK
jgi:hypothetical protein